MTRYLTKSRFKLAIECPTKLFYTRKKEYPDKMATDPFMEALAEGGFQVGELAKCYYPGGIDITTLDYDKAIQQTNELLERENVVIFEGAFKYKNLFIRADIIEKKGNLINLLEVKSKSFDGDDEDFIGKRSKNIKPDWLPYLFDVAFQKYVIQESNPEFEVKSFLMMADKTKHATVNGLNQKFQLLKTNEGRKYCVTVGDVTKEALGEEILIRVNIDEMISDIHNGDYTSDFQEGEFNSWISYLSNKYEQDEKIHISVHKGCGKCQFRCTAEEEQMGKKSGFKECWEQKTTLRGSDFDEPLIFDLWRGGMGSKDMLTPLIGDNIFFLKDILESYYLPKSETKYENLSPPERRTLQIEKCINNDTEPFIDIEGLKQEFSKWKFPLHFIDFETSCVAIPFNEGRKPYEGIAFQFSHHQVEKDGTISHKGQYINARRGEFPNFEFIRELKKQLEKDEGTIFRYAAHENTFLNMIYRQLNDMNIGEVEDKQVLMDFIKTISKSKNDYIPVWEGERNMVDMLELVKDFYYDPAMKGSNSIKFVLPAVLNASRYLQMKYSKPIYGKNLDINSLNLDQQIWIKYDENNKVINPYKLLPDIFEGISAEEMDKYITDSKLADGGAAMTAYAKMQFTEMSDNERQRIIDGLFRYCELDTMAMVFIWEYWNDLIK